MRPLKIVHVIYRLDVGGMENGLVNLINGLPSSGYSHCIICLTKATAFAGRIQRPDVEIIECHKPEGHHPATYWRILRALKRQQPDIVHTRNLGTLDYAWVALLAGVRVRVHSEHGWSASDPAGKSLKHRLLRRLCNPAIHRYVAVSKDIHKWLINVIGIRESKVQVIHNGVDTRRFRGAGGDKRGFVTDVQAGGKIVFGTLGRQEPIKGLEVLLLAIRDLLAAEPERRQQMKTVLAGHGPSHEKILSLLEEYGLEDIVECPGAVEDVPELMRQFDFFVQPSINEGISNTILEAMASGLPVVASRVGGNPELITDGVSGVLVSPSDSSALMLALAGYLDDADLRSRHGRAAREEVERRLSLDAMVGSYDRFYRDHSVEPSTATT